LWSELAQAQQLVPQPLSPTRNALAAATGANVEITFDQVAKPEAKPLTVNLLEVLFYFNETRIKPESFPLLDEAKKVLEENPQILKVRIEGHTDERGKAADSLKLSAGRARAVLRYLVKNGISRSRLSSKGFGFSRPLVKGAETKEDHQRNRRVEFVILKQDKPK